jgi:hypothetical protein
MDKKPRTAITYVKYTDENGCEQECTTTVEINDTCINEGNKRYAQAHGSPFLTGLLLEDLGFLCNKNKVQDILDGTYDCPEEVDEFTKQIVHELQRPKMANRHATITGYTTTDKHIKGWKRCEWEQPPAPSDRHFPKSSQAPKMWQSQKSMQPLFPSRHSQDIVQKDGPRQ